MTDIVDEYGLLDDADRILIESAVLAAFNANGKRGNVDVTVCPPDVMRALNVSTRHIDAVTDVLSFPASDEQNSPPDGFWGDIVICIARAKQQSQEYGHSYERELAFLTIHGMLHLFGFDHEEEAGERSMRLAQASILERMGLLQ